MRLRTIQEIQRRAHRLDGGCDGWGRVARLARNGAEEVRELAAHLRRLWPVAPRIQARRVRGRRRS